MDGCHSLTVKSNTGVPLGSVWGLFLFFIFTTPIGNLIDSFGVTYRYHQYVDEAMTCNYNIYTHQTVWQVCLLAKMR